MPGCRVIVPCLRGFGATRFRDAATLRSGKVTFSSSGVGTATHLVAELFEAV
jgi:hypothetical protein